MEVGHLRAEKDEVQSLDGVSQNLERREKKINEQIT